ncbi:MAG: pyruvate dehydrogenase (acetyl-transferring) E1 component subunit alpha [Gammaproteobacteria bacterium]|nr:pyruvate dehydrogenase (acetyl-transferring) E1 component subunit alpha [Gammaproteobacteria bacterium]
MTNEEKKCIAQFEIHHTQLLNQAGERVGPLPDFATSYETLLTLYRTMVQTRTFDSKAIALQRTGKMGTYSSSLGQEAVATGIGHAMHFEDVLLPTYREYAAQFQRGVAMSEILRYWGGDERGMAYANQPHDMPITVPIATHVPQCAGIAYAMKLRKEARVAVCVLGDGATSKGDFYEGINLAGAWQLPMVVVVTNNHWAISVPRKVQTHAQTLAQKAIAAGIPGEQVDGNDVIAMRHVMSNAIEKARSGGGPTLVEAMTYRMHDHTTADDASRYRNQSIVDEHKLLDPIDRLRKYLTANHDWDDAKEQRLHDECIAEVETAVNRYLDTPPVPPETMFDHLYETLPDALQSQRDEVELLGKQKKGGGQHG